MFVNSPIFRRGYRTLQFGKFVLFAEGSILRHQGKIRFVLVVFGKPFDDFFTVRHTERHNHMPHDDTRFHHSVFVERSFFRVHHKLHGVLRNFEIIFSPRVSRGDVRRKKLQVGEVNIDERVYQIERFLRFVGMSVVNHGYFRAVNFKRFNDFLNEMRRRYEIYIVNAHILENFKDIRKFSRRNFFSAFGTRKSEILAEYASERTPREEDRPRAVFSAYRRLFEHMGIVFGDAHNRFFAARPGRFISVRNAVFRA